MLILAICLGAAAVIAVCVLWVLVIREFENLI
jgi:hypothetical protein